jgi:hypothetical protein
MDTPAVSRSCHPSTPYKHNFYWGLCKLSRELRNGLVDHCHLWLNKYVWWGKVGRIAKAVDQDHGLPITNHLVVKLSGIWAKFGCASRHCTKAPAQVLRLERLVSSRIMAHFRQLPRVGGRLVLVGLQAVSLCVRRAIRRACRGLDYWFGDTYSRAEL